MTREQLFDSTARERTAVGVERSNGRVTMSLHAIGDQPYSPISPALTCCVCPANEISPQDEKNKACRSWFFLTPAN